MKTTKQKIRTKTGYEVVEMGIPFTVYIGQYAHQFAVQNPNGRMFRKSITHLETGCGFAIVDMSSVPFGTNLKDAAKEAVQRQIDKKGIEAVEKRLKEVGPLA